MFHQIPCIDVTFWRRFIETLNNLQCQVKGGKLKLSRITDKFNAAISPQSVSEKKVSAMLRDLGLTTEKSAGKYSYLLWESSKIQKLFSETTLTTKQKAKTK
jgi:hypothetical protein